MLSAIVIKVIPTFMKKIENDQYQSYSFTRGFEFTGNLDAVYRIDFLSPALFNKCLGLWSVLSDALFGGVHWSLAQIQTFGYL